ncbi:Ribonucleases P/MRP protein subunit POP1 family protein [Candida albicans]|uniref:Ribonucleases P/MRP protein subunit POP1 family protein n=2 Tax=Candida albicans TaxID=5476 RepID=A0A8H6BWP0_CANAX|nr:Ribonucleases P/MRP protein subunit POP1 family protein [Candida albicans]
MSTNSKQLNKKKTRLYNSRTIKSQINDQAYDKKQRVLDVNSFIHSRNFEIRSFEQSQLNSKNASSTRVFQDLPRALRRRAASHNVKRIPKRLRKRAKHEMSSNLPVKKMPRGRRLYKLLVRNRLLKVASKMKQNKYDPLENLVNKKNLRKQFKAIRDEIKKIDQEKPKSSTVEGFTKLNNSVGSRDNTGVNELAPRPKGSIKYYKRQREFVWIPTHIWLVKRFHMSKKYGYQIPYTPTQKCFKLMNRWNRQKAVCFDTSYFPTFILYVSDGTMFGDIAKQLCGKKVCPGFAYMNQSLNTIMVRVVPSMYEQLFQSYKAKIESIPNSTINDCRYALGSIELSGPLSIKCLSKIFHFQNISPDLKNIWASLSKIKDSDLVPVGTTFTFNLQDPRIWQRPTKLRHNHNGDQDIYDIIIALNSSPHIDQDIVKSLTTSEGRYASYKDQLSIKELGKFHANLNKKPSDISHSQIPVLLSKTDSQKWLLILPWHWILPFWIQITKVTDIKPGGSKQMHQFQFENHKPYYPQDFPWSYDGWQYNKLVGEANQIKASKLPKSQVSVQQSEKNYSVIFNANKCDWTNLRNMVLLMKYSKMDRKTIKKDSGQPDFAQYDGPERIINSVHDLLQTTKSVENDITDVNEQQSNFVNDGTIEDNARLYSDSSGTDIHCVGFVTTGAMNLNLGKYSGIGTIIAQKWLIEENGHKLYVRNPGKSKVYSVSFRVI